MTFDLKVFMERVLGFEKNCVKPVIDPLHGQIGLTDLEDRVVNTKAFKRLKNVQQLGFASNIYPAATHKRYEHCIGTLHVTWTMLKQLLKNYIAQQHWNNYDVLDFFSNDLLESLRLAALLHDAGHGPFSHSFEQVAVNLGQKLDHDDITTYLLTNGLPEESLRNLFSDSELESFKQSEKLNSFRDGLGIIPLKNRETIIGIYDRKYEMRLSKPNGFDNIRLFLNNLLKGDIGSDRIDYLLRDTYFSGLGHRFNFSDLLENLRAIYDKSSGRLLLAVDVNGKSIVEFLMMTRFYHYKLIAHHPRNVLEEIKFQERVKKHITISQKPTYFLDATSDDDSIERELPNLDKEIELVGIWNMGQIGIDHYRFLFYRIGNDSRLRGKYAGKIKENIIDGVNRQKKSELSHDDIFLAFIMEESHIPILQIYQPTYLIEKDDAWEKYSVLLHDRSILIRGLARTYLEDSSLLIYTRKDYLDIVSKFTSSTHHFYLNAPLFTDCLSNVLALESHRYDFLLYALYKVTRGGQERFSSAKRLFDEIRNLQEKNKLSFYDFASEDFYDPDSGAFSYPKVSGKEKSLIDDLFLFDASGLIEIKMHLVNRKREGKDFYSDSYLFVPTKRHEEVGLSNPMIPLESAVRLYPKSFKDLF